MKPRPDLTALEESDLEDAIAERLEEVGVDGAYDLAPVFATAGIDAAWVDDVVEQVDSGLEWSAAFGWLRYTLETETLMSEIEEAADPHLLAGRRRSSSTRTWTGPSTRTST